MIEAKTTAARIILKAAGGLSRRRLQERLSMSPASWSRRVKSPGTFTLAEVKRLAEVTGMSNDELVKLIKSVE